MSFSTSKPNATCLTRFTAPFTHIQLALELLVSEETNVEKLLYLDVIRRNTERLFQSMITELPGLRA